VGELKISFAIKAALRNYVMEDLGETQKVSLSSIFSGEASEFTPWLLQNLGALASELGLELEPEGSEVSVGSFRADIHARTTDNRVVVIENQFNTTDHAHLGQLLTYGAGLDAQIVIWIAELIRDEHRAAVDWLNDKATDMDFFAIEARAIRINDSLPALLWDVVASPNNWSRTAKKTASSNLGPLQKLRLEWWAALNSQIEKHGVNLTKFKPAPESWQGGSIGKGGFWLNTVTNSVEQIIRVEIYLSDEQSGDWFNGLSEKRLEIEEALGYELNWDPLEGKKASRICISDNANLMNREDWENQHNWVIQRRLDFEKVFKPLVMLVTK
jgi:hypothetical protein